MGARAGYEIIEDGKSSFFYSDWGANLLTAPERFEQAREYKQQNAYSSQSISTLMSSLDYEGRYHSRLFRENQVFIPVSTIVGKEMKSLVQSPHIQSSLLAYIKIDLDNDKYEYNALPSLGTSLSIKGAFSDLLNLTKEISSTDRADFYEREERLRTAVLNSGKFIKVDNRVFLEKYYFKRDPNKIQMRYYNPDGGNTEYGQIYTVSIMGTDTIKNALNSSNISEAIIQNSFPAYIEDVESAVDLEVFMREPCDFSRLGTITESDAILKDVVEQSLNLGTKLVLLQYEGTLPTMQTITVESDNDISKAIKSYLDRGNGCEIGVLAGTDQDLMAFINKKDAGKSGNPVVIANREGAGYGLSNEQISRLEKQFHSVSGAVGKKTPTIQKTQGRK